MAVWSGGLRVSYLDEAIDGNVATVWTAIVRAGGGEVLFDYAMIRHEKRWLVRDVFVEGVSVSFRISGHSFRGSSGTRPIRGW